MKGPRKCRVAPFCGTVDGFSRFTDASAAATRDAQLAIAVPVSAALPVVGPLAAVAIEPSYRILRTPGQLVRRAAGLGAMPPKKPGEIFGLDPQKAGAFLQQAGETLGAAKGRKAPKRIAAKPKG